MGKLKIRCIYEKNGCKDVLLLHNLENRENFCGFNEKIFEKCLCDKLVDHNCIQSLSNFKQKLLQKNDELLQTNYELEDKFTTALNQISSPKSENENYLRLIEELSNANTSKPCTSNEVNYYKYCFDYNFFALSITINVCLFGDLILNLFF